MLDPMVKGIKVGVKDKGREGVRDKKAKVKVEDNNIAQRYTRMGRICLPLKRALAVRF